MKITLNKVLKRIEVITWEPIELKKLKGFPGLLNDGLYFFTPLRPRVAYNLVRRLIKKFPKVQVDADVYEHISKVFKLKDIPLSFKFFTEPKDFQRIALRYMYTTGGGGLLLEPGMGKTKVVLDFIALMGFKKSLIICPLPLLFVWEDEQKLHRPDKSIYCIESTEWEKEIKGLTNADIVVVNYNKAVLLSEFLVDQGFEFIGVDEALIKDPSSGRTKALTWLSKKIPHKMIMSGTLVNNSPLDVFAPVRFLEPSLVGQSFYNFKEEYAVEVGAKEKRFVVGYRNVPEIKSILESVSIVMTKEKWLKLPPKKFIDVWVQASDEQRQKYWDLQSNYITTLGDKTLEVDNPLTVLCKLIQIANGFAYITPHAELGELDAEAKPTKAKRETYYFPEQPKMDRLIELLEGELKGKRAMIWYNMQGEYELIKKSFENKNYKYITIHGGERETGCKIRTYNSDPSYTYLLCQSKTVNYGVTVLGQDDEEDAVPAISGISSRVYTQIFYSLNFSLETYLQQQDRIHRMGQEHECAYYRLFTNLPAEKHIKEKIDEKLSVRGQILQDVIHDLGIRDIGI